MLNGSFSNVGAKTKGTGVTCIYCRAKWTVAVPALAPAAGGSRAVQTSEGYLNLSTVAGLSPVRDTSSCTSIVLVEVES